MRRALARVSCCALVLACALSAALPAHAQAAAPAPQPEASAAGETKSSSAVDTWGSGAREAPSTAGAETSGIPEPRAPLSDAGKTCPCPPGVEPHPGLVTQAVRYTLEGVEVRGNTRTRAQVVLRYVPFKRGDVFDVDDPEVELSRYRLLGTGFFRDVQFSLRKGSSRGLVVLVIEVVERNTIVVNDVRMGISADADTHGNSRPLTAYGAIDVAETNLVGTGITLGSAMAVAEEQLALRVRFLDPAFLGSSWMTSGTLLYNNARDFFGNAGVLKDDPAGTSSSQSAVVNYKRFGGSLGVGRDLSISTQLWLNYRLETLEASYPLEASHLRGARTDTGDSQLAREPIDFDIIRGRSVLSTLRATLEHDTRDHPFLPTRGWHASVMAEVGLLPFGSDYDYQRAEVAASHWWRLPWNEHVLRLELFAGAISGNAPFFEQYYVGDFSDFLPSRILGVNFDRRPPPNFLGTDIVEVRYGKYAAKIAGEYRVPLFRGHRSIYGIDFFASMGIYGVAGTRDITSPPVGYSGFAQVPIDLTGNFGFRMDTSAGGFVFAFSNVLGFIPVRGKGPAGGQ
ncbi:MAG TPA: BamA/TamA family outer membrane protein [Polyangiaceae bacterium]|nr:BamA/TamA family outer membrane protein [Polyangiaceae bacterium]